MIGIVLVLLVGCQTRNPLLEISRAPFSHEAQEKSEFGAPAHYARWKRPNVILYVASDSAALYSATEQAVAEINRALGFDLLILKGLRSVEDGAVEYNGRNSVNTIVEVSDRDYVKIAERNPNSLAITKLIWSKGQLYEADILIRRSTITSRFLQATILHEMGHLLGLGHTQDQRSFMYPELRDPRRSILGPNDARVIRDRYSLSRPALSQAVK